MSSSLSICVVMAGLNSQRTGSKPLDGFAKLVKLSVKTLKPVTLVGVVKRISTNALGFPAGSAPDSLMVAANKLLQPRARVRTARTLRENWGRWLVFIVFVLFRRFCLRRYVTYLAFIIEGFQRETYIDCRW